MSRRQCHLFPSAFSQPFPKVLIAFIVMPTTRLWHDCVPFIMFSQSAPCSVQPERRTISTLINLYPGYLLPAEILFCFFFSQDILHITLRRDNEMAQLTLSSDNNGTLCQGTQMSFGTQDKNRNSSIYMLYMLQCNVVY